MQVKRVIIFFSIMFYLLSKNEITKLLNAITTIHKDPHLQCSLSPTTGGRLLNIPVVGKTMVDRGLALWEMRT